MSTVFPDVPKAGSLPDVGNLQPVVHLDRLEVSPEDQARGRRASTPLEASGITMDSIIFVEEPTLVREEGETSEASSTIFAPSKAKKRGRGTSPDVG